MAQSIIKSVTAALTLALVRGRAAALERAARWRRSRPPFDGGRLAAFALVAVVMTVAAEPAYAQSAGGNTDLSTIMQNAVNIVTGTVGKIVCIGVVAVTGILTAAGACSMHTLGRVALGIGVLFSSAWLVGQLLGS